MIRCDPSLANMGVFPKPVSFHAIDKEDFVPSKNLAELAFGKGSGPHSLLYKVENRLDF